ncbi:hypothetical protein [Staphylococcus equorum]|nr:hypothetical protein [Staphylococcus equorum]MDW5472301.1 hypothetical protein [Staphylococcus equorum]
MKYLLYILLLSLLSVLFGLVLDIFIAIAFYGIMAVSGIKFKKMEAK